MKILYCITSASWGGAQLNVLELCQNQIQRGNQVVFVVGNHGRLLDLVSKLAGVKVILLPELQREISLINDIKAVFKLRRLIKQEHPDIIHLHSSKAGTVGRLAAIKLDCKVIFTVHGWAFTDGISSGKRKTIFKWIEKIVAPFTDLYICVSNFDQEIGIRDRVLKPNKKNYVVIHNGAPSPQKFNRGPALYPIRLVMTARFSSQKDQKSLIQAVSSIDKSKYHLSLVGDGETLKDNIKLVEKLGLTSTVSFEGFKADVSYSLINSDIYILSTHYEGLPISIIEAMSYKLPIIATNVGGNKELVEDNGFLVSNIEDLTKRIKYLIDNPDVIRELGDKSYKLYEHEYTLEHCMNRTNHYYRELIKR